MELVVAQVQGGVDGLEGLKVNVQLLLLAVLSHDGPSVHHQTIGRHLYRFRKGVLCSL